MVVPFPLAPTKPTPAGSASVTTTPPATLGPRFVTLIVYVTFPPAYAPATFATFPTARSASGVTATTAAFVLFNRFGSATGDPALAVFVSGPPPGATDTMLMFVTPPAGNVPTLMFVVPPPGSTSTTSTFVATLGPAFVTLITFV